MTNAEAEDSLDFRVGDNAAGALIGLVQRIERLEEEKSALGDDIKEVYAEAKTSGFDTKIMRRAIALRKLDPKDRAAAQELLDTYMAAMGEKS
jgi:uncharacterized protein (UPF0335 family)